MTPRPGLPTARRLRLFALWRTACADRDQLRATLVRARHDLLTLSHHAGHQARHCASCTQMLARIDQALAPRSHPPCP